ncbi:MAG TPA: cyclopropane fatty acyl phospholipid synthase [Bacteroidota bacterium]|nr:cyclopropane fatty acyl phospholipid synthase [Bacteroidota bacterium]
MNRQKQKIEKYLNSAGITIDGPQLWDINVINQAFYSRVLARGSLGLGESYVDGWWDVEQLDEFFSRILRANLERYVEHNWRSVFDVLSARLVNLQKPSRAFIIGTRHYDIGNNLFRSMLDARMVYSCGYWQHASTLDEAQEAKLELICRKLALEPGMTVLDIGCGWGGFAKYAAENYSANVLGITVSAEQATMAKDVCAGLPVIIKLQDYRDLDSTFDRIVSIGMFEHVGAKNYRTFMKVVRDHLHDDGLFLLHTIGGNATRYATDPWIAEYIFPNSLIPSIDQIARASEGMFVMEDWHNFSAFYDKTLMAWHQNFEKNWKGLASQYDERFFRMWKYYLLSSAGSFRSRHNQLWQIVFSPKGINGGYESIRERAIDRTSVRNKRAERATAFAEKTAEG